MKKEANKIQFAIVAVDAVVFRLNLADERLEVLLGEVNIPPYFVDRQGVIGGLVKPEETTDQALLRHLSDKAGVKNVYSEQLYTFSRTDRDPRGRVVSVAHLVLTNNYWGKMPVATLETDWLPVTSLPELAYDHNEIIDVSLNRLRTKIVYTDIIKHLLPREFTLSQMQKAYEIILDKKLDKRNFRKKINSLDLVKPTGKKDSSTSRLAQLYCFSKKEIRIIEIL